MRESYLYILISPAASTRFHQHHSHGRLVAFCVVAAVIPFSLCSSQSLSLSVSCSSRLWSFTFLLQPRLLQLLSLLSSQPLPSHLYIPHIHTRRERKREREREIKREFSIQIHTTHTSSSSSLFHFHLSLRLRLSLISHSSP